MKRLQPHVVVLGLLIVACGMLWNVRTGSSKSAAPHQPLAKESVPEKLGDWRGSGIVIDDKSVQILETNDIAVMEFHRRDEEVVWFAQVAGFGKRAAFHPPELCYIGSHYEVLERERKTVAIDGAPHDIMRLVIGQDGQFFEAWYWFTANGRVTANYYAQQAWLVFDSLRGKESSGTLVRVSTPLDRKNVDEAQERLCSFIAALEGNS